MQLRQLIMLSLLTVSFGGQVIAAEQTAGAGVEKATPTPKPKAHHHKKDCVEKDGKPCHLHKQTKTSTNQEPASRALPVAAASAVAPVAVTAPAVAAATAAPSKPEIKTEAALSYTDGRALAQKSGCFTCHAIDKKVVGPAWKTIADKYRGDAGATARLISKVSKGGSGAWGSTPMPANSPRVKDADIQALVKFILSLK